MDAAIELRLLMKIVSFSLLNFLYDVFESVTDSGENTF